MQKSNQWLWVAAVWVACAAGAGESVGEEKPEAKRSLRHVVLFKFKEDTTPGKVAEIVKAFAELPKKIDVIADFEYGTDNSPEMLANGFTHCFLVTFSDEKGRETYLPHPAHQEFVKLLKPHLDKVLVIDYWTQQ